MTSKSIICPVALPTIHPFVAMDIPELFRMAAETHGTRTFLIWEPFEGNTQRWSYAEAWRDLNRIASGLAILGVGAGDAVLLHLDNSPESIFCWLACGFIGAVSVTTNARCAGEELAYFAEKVGAVGILTQPAFEAVVREHLPSIGWVFIAEPGSAAAMMGSDALLPERAADPSAPFGIQFTSGTTSRPKAVLWTHANALWGAMVGARHLGLRAEDVGLIVSPLFHTVAQTWQVLASVWVGGSVVLQPKFSASRFWDIIVSKRCTWAPAGKFVEFALADIAIPVNHDLRFVLNEVNGKPITNLWGVRSVAAHGMTEIITQSILCDPSGPVDEGALGRPAPEYLFDVRDTEGDSIKLGGTGELHIKGVRGLSIFAEYFDDPTATAAAFTEDGFFRTGDNVQMRSDGALMFIDRVKDMLKVGGENVAASEIEAVVRRVPGVQEVAIVAQEHPMLGEVPFAFVVAAPHAPANLGDQLIATCRQALADFKVPRGVLIVDDFPRSLGGAKVAKAVLRQMLRDKTRAQASS